MSLCEAALLTCEDFRLHQRKDGRNYVADFIKSLGVDCDLITRGGGVLDLVRPFKHGSAFNKSVLRDMDVSTKLHQARVIILMNHADCGAYRFKNFSSREKEAEKHHRDLRTAEKVLREKFPGKEIRLFFAELEPETNDVFAIKEVS